MIYFRLRGIASSGKIVTVTSTPPGYIPGIPCVVRVLNGSTVVAGTSIIQVPVPVLVPGIYYILIRYYIQYPGYN